MLMCETRACKTSEPDGKARVCKKILAQTARLDLLINTRRTEYDHLLVIQVFFQVF